MHPRVLVALDELRNAAPSTDVTGNERFIGNDEVIVATAVAVGINMSFHAVARLSGKKITAEGAKYIEYPWAPGQ